VLAQLDWKLPDEILNQSFDADEVLIANFRAAVWLGIPE